MSAQQYDEIEVYEFDDATTIRRLTAAEFDVVPSSYLIYSSAQISRSAITQGLEPGKSTLEFRLPPDAELVGAAMGCATSGRTMSVKVLTTRFVAGMWQIPVTRWLGRVLGAEIADDAAKIRCEAALVSLKRIGLRRLYTRSCSHVLYSEACGAGVLADVANVVAVSGRVVDVDTVPALLVGALAGGWLQTAVGERYMIVAESGNRIELIRDAGFGAGQQVGLYAGCDHRVQTCQSRFNNLDNYGGFPHIPVKNPFAASIF